MSEDKFDDDDIYYYFDDEDEDDDIIDYDEGLDKEDLLGGFDSVDIMYKLHEATIATEDNSKGRFVLALSIGLCVAFLIALPFLDIRTIYNSLIVKLSEVINYI